MKRSAFLLALLVGCGARTSLSENERSDGGVEDVETPFDVPRPDVPLPDVPRPDVPLPDVPPDIPVPDVPFPDIDEDVPPGVACERDLDCDGSCVRNVGEAIVDLDPAALHCAPLPFPSGQADGGECTRSEDCGRGLCLVSDICAAPCVEDRDCGFEDQCAPIYYRGTTGSLETGRACMPRIVEDPRLTTRNFRTRVLRVDDDSEEILLGRTEDQVVLHVLGGYRSQELITLSNDAGDVYFDLFGVLDGRFSNPVAFLDSVQIVALPLSNRSAPSPMVRIGVRGRVPRTVPDAPQWTLRGPRGGSQLRIDVFHLPSRFAMGGDRVLTPRLRAGHDPTRKIASKSLTLG